jgi:cytochrome c553
MNSKRTVFFVAIGLFLAGAAVFAAGQPATNALMSTPPIYVPDISHSNDPLPDGILAWDELSKATDAAADQQVAHFVFSFTNVTSGKVIILNVRPSCGCTTAELPPLPWTIAPGANGQIPLSVNIQGKSGTLYKTVNVSTDKGSKMLVLHINILPPVIPKMTEAERARGVAAAKIDRQAVFREDCAKCHLNNIQGKYGKPLYDSVCAICHEAEQRATMVPDLHNLKTPTNDEFWRTWIAHGKPGSLMPAFATSDGGPLTDIQIASLTAYLNAMIPSQAPVNK